MFKRLQPLFPYFKKHRWSYAMGSVCVLMQNGIAVLIPLLIGRAFDHLKNGVSRQQLFIDAALVLGVWCAKGIFLYLNRKIVISISREIEFEMRNDLFQHLESLSYSFYQRTRTGDIMARATN
ncbi:MAG TPA: ABC transporter transmembrane domain-containing protein, partial [Terriglobales bacterium]|nr:ABC transporter transmembrane domain-containing protein [Terriglobales bacterium]